MNPLKSQIVKFTYKKNIINHPVYLTGIAIPTAQSVKYLGVTFDSKLTWATHINNLVKKIRFRIHQLKHLISSIKILSLLYDLTGGSACRRGQHLLPANRVYSSKTKSH